MGMPSTSLPRSSRKRAGFTLIEVMIVISIIAVAIALAVPRIFKSESNIRSVARTLTVLSREIRNRAKLSNSSMRLVVDMRQEPHRYWVERATGKVLIAKDLYKEKQDTGNEENKKPPYAIDTLLTKTEKSLPKGLFFKSLETLYTEEPIESGLAYIHFSPEGFMEAAALQIGDKKDMVWTLLFNPLTGQAEVLPEPKTLKEITQ